MNWIVRILQKLGLIFVVLVAATSIVVMAYGFIPVPITPLMAMRSFEQISQGKKLKIKKDWQAVELISPHLQEAIVVAEDQHFFEHYGFDFEAIEKAIKYNRAHRKTKGASTISQQVAKNVFLWPQRSWIRKGFEVYFTGLIEIFWSKERIMEVYLNIAEWGDGIYGAEAASQYYFRKSSRNLSQGEAAWLACVLPNPRKWQIPRPTSYMRMRQSRILRLMRLAHSPVFRGE
jgi:monofunctional biosynthetic peptidoglycan transglycosylase